MGLAQLFPVRLLLTLPLLGIFLAFQCILVPFDLLPFGIDAVLRRVHGLDGLQGRKLEKSHALI